AVRQFKIEPAATAQSAPIVVDIAAKCINKAGPMEIPGIGSVVIISAELPAVTSTSEATVFRSASRRYHSALRLLRLFGDNVDHAVHRVRTPQCRTRAANDF